MTYTFPPELDSLLQEEMARGTYASLDDLLVTAICVLRDRDAAIEGIREGIADLEAGRTRLASDFFGGLRKRNATSVET